MTAFPTATDTRPRTLPDLGWLTMAWAVSQTGYWLHFGVRLGGDSGRYVDGAWRLINGTPLTGEQHYYLAYEGLLAPILYAGGGLAGAVALQALLAWGGAVALYDLGRRLFGPGAGLAAALAYLLNPAVQRWNFYVLTETLATVTLIGSLALAVAVREKGWAAIPLLLCAGVLTFSRPEGIFFLLPVILYLLAEKTGPGFRAGWVLAGFCGLVMGLRSGMTQGFGLSEQWLLGTYIWGYPGIGAPALADPIPGQLPYHQLLAQSLLQDPGWAARLTARKIFYFLIPWRPYFSRFHNLAGLGLQLAAYLLALIGSRPLNKHVLLLWSICATQLGLTALTWSDWDNRWADRVMPLIGLLAAAGAVALVRRLRGKDPEKKCKMQSSKCKMQN